ncbi:hypothetical protein ACHAW5_008543 [Stephanodiscus triporus]|uniref:Exportin-1/Importin-beta-like domain-containing protein n=1 Tax=Stephanodiscus triporus TaxID=2934178 RepID=A0ABD3NQ74_9STRA
MTTTMASAGLIRRKHSPELPRVLLALQTVYAPNACTGGGGGGGGDNFDRRDVADRYLTSFQRAPVAWMVCDRLLSSGSAVLGDSNEDPTLRTQRQFFAAQTLHAKCLGDVHQLPRSSLPSLRDSLLSHFVTHASDAARAPHEDRPANRPLVTRLSMAIAALAVHMGWTSGLVDVAEGVLVPNPQLGPAVLELFRSIPEEADSGRLVMASEDGDGGGLRAYRDMLRKSAHVVLGLCEGAVASSSASSNGGGGSDVATTEAVLGCLQSWIRIVDIDPSLLEHTSLLPWVFDLLVDSSNGGFEMAVDVVVELLRAYPSDRGGVEGLIRAVIPRVMALGSDFGGANDAGGNGGPPARPSPFQKSILEEDEDGMRGYCRIFTEMSESYLSLILSHEEMNQASLVELVLRCSSIPDNEIAGITLHFWYRFVVGLEELEPFEYRQIKIDSFAPQLTRLLDVCTRLLRYPAGVEDLSPDRLDDIEGIRAYFADTIEDCCRLLGGDAVLRAMGDPLQEECRRVASLPPDSQLADWHGIEGYMYAIQAVSMYVPPDETRNIPFVMGLIPQLPGDVPLLRATACRIVGKYASWLGMQPSYLGPLLPYLAQGLSMPKCASAAAVAIREICERCDALGDSVLQLYEDIVAAREQHRRSSAGGIGGEDFILNLKNELEVLEGVCKAVSCKLTNNPSIIHHLARPIIDNLRAMASPDAYPSPKHITAEVCRLTTLVQHLRLPRPSSQETAGTLNRSNFILSVMGETWPMLDAVSQKHPRDFNCGEKLCRLHKHALRECGSAHYAPLLKPLVEQTIKNFSTSLSSPYLYLASIIVSEYGRDVTHSNLLFDMMTRLASTVFHALRSTDDFTAHPDVVEEFFFLAGRMVSHCPSPLVQSSLLHSLLQCAGIGMKLHHKDANRGTLNFLENTVSYSLKLRSSSSLDAIEQANIASLEQAIAAEGQPLVINLALALLGDLPAYRLDSGSGSIAGVLFYLNQLCPELLMQWIQPPLTAAPEHAKSAFMVTLHNRVAREEFNSSVRRFTAVCERSRGRR